MVILFAGEAVCALKSCIAHSLCMKANKRCNTEKKLNIAGTTASCKLIKPLNKLKHFK